MTIYLFKVVCCSGLLLLAYWLILEKEKMFHFNRFYLLLGIVFSLVIPLVTVQTVPISAVNEVMISINPEFDTQGALPVPSPKSPTNWPNALLLIYLTITAAMCFRFGRNLLALLKSIDQNEIVDLENAKVVLLNRVTAPHSFFHYLFVSKENFCQGRIQPQILRHELAHVYQKHSYDILVIELLLTFAWINPILFLYRRAIQLNHEFLADEFAAESGSVSEYQRLLVNEPYQEESLTLSSSFNYAFTKKRVIMITKKTSRGTAIAKQFSVALLLAACLFAFGERVVAQQIRKASKQAQEGAQKAQKASQKDAQQAQKASLQAQKDAQQSQKDAQRAEKEIQQPRKENQTTYVSVRKLGPEKVMLDINTSDAKATPTSNAQTWTLKQDEGSVQFKSERPLLDLEKRRIENAFLKSTTAPLPKFPPTQAQLDSFLDGTVYGVWINGKRVYNWELKGSKAEDFSDVRVSALTKNAMDYGKYLFHVELKKKDGC